MNMKLRGEINMSINKKPTNTDIINKIEEMFLVLQSINVKWTTPEIMINYISQSIESKDQETYKQIIPVVNQTLEFLLSNNLLEEGIIDDNYMPDHLGMPGYKMLADFSSFRLTYENGQITKTDLPKYNPLQECEESEQ